MRNTPLKVEIKNDELVIRIGIDVLKFGAEEEEATTEEETKMTPEQMWQAVAEKIEPRPVVLGGDREWHLHPYDAEMCLMLLKRLPWPEITRFKDLMNKGWMVVPHWDRPAENFVAAELEEAILAAAYKSLCEDTKL